MTVPLIFRDELTGEDAISFTLDDKGNLTVVQITPDVEETETVMYPNEVQELVRWLLSKGQSR